MKRIRLLFIGSGLLLGAFAPLQSNSDLSALNIGKAAATPVFYSMHTPAHCPEVIRSLTEHTYRLDPESNETIGVLPSWSPTAFRSDYFMFNLHTLRFTECLIREGELGDTAALKRARDAITDWATRAEIAYPDGAWEEHASAWRAVVLGYFWTTWRAHGHEDPRTTRLMLALADRHGAYLMRPSVYRPDHNHGVTHALALVTLGTAFPDRPHAPEWVATGLARAEQQMRDNVSTDGIHLEQSGFYHAYVLRSLLEIARVAASLGRPMSEAYMRKLDLMVGAVRAMVDARGVIRGLPYSDPSLDVINDLLDLRDTYPIPGALSTTNQNTILRFANEPSPLMLYPEGGYAFFTGQRQGKVSIVFHTRILNAWHAHADPLGVSASILGLPIVVIPSTMYMGEHAGWYEYFVGPAAHNIIQVDHLAPQLVDRRRPGPINLLLDSYKLERLADWLGLADALTKLRQLIHADRLSLRERAVPSGGEITASGSTENLDYVTARESTYPGVAHTRTVVRLGGKLLVVRDRLTSLQTHSYSQTFHFGPAARVDIDGNKGTVHLGDGVLARFMQLETTQPRLCRGEIAPERCGWFSNSVSTPIATFAVHYGIRASKADFLWIMAPGIEEFNASLEPAATGENANQLLHITYRGREYRLRLIGDRAQLVEPVAGQARSDKEVPNTWQRVQPSHEFATH
jgi:hypothetical protein